LERVVSDLTSSDIHDAILDGLTPPRRAYWFVVTVLGLGVMLALVAWLYQVQTGMGVAGINQPVGWAFYITNFVFWVGIGHAGTLISAILYLARSRWRAAVSRAAEAMTVFAVVTATLFPLVHLGRVWVFYYILPYPSQRQIWPNFTSPLVWDVVAVLTYLTVSTIFWFVGLVPDVAGARDRWAERHGERDGRTRVYRKMALGWTGSSRQWRHFGRSYLFFAALATPLVVSVHSVVSWDFAMSNLPGWHSTIFAPYFVAGAIHSGLAMVLTLLIPLRRLLRLERLITVDHFESAAKTMLVTALIVGYAYLIEPFIAWYSGDRFEQQFAAYRATGLLAPYYWSLSALNVLVPLVFLFRRARRSLRALFVVGLGVNLGMWLERWVIIAGSLTRDFLPHNWGHYAPTWVEISITIGSFTFFLLWFVLFAKHLPTVAGSDVKELAAGGGRQASGVGRQASGVGQRSVAADHETSGVVGVYRTPAALVAALRSVLNAPFRRVETFTPFHVEEATALLHRRPSPVRYWTLVGALTGLIGGFWLAFGSAAVNSLVVGAKYTPRAVLPYCIIGFEGAVLLGTIANLTGMLVHGGLARGRRERASPAYDRRFSCDRFGLFIACRPAEFDSARVVLAATDPEEMREVAAGSRDEGGRSCTSANCTS
jgi:Ni/Fe-hydrogenase subunit HybB-like protein